MMAVARHVRLVCAAGLLMCLLASAGCARTVDFDFESSRRIMEASANGLLGSVAATDSARIVRLPPDESQLAVDGEVWAFDVGGHKYVFFPYSVEEPNFYVGYAYSPDGSVPSELLVDGDEGGMPMRQVAPHWWKGELHQRWLARERIPSPAAVLAAR